MPSVTERIAQSIIDQINSGDTDLYQITAFNNEVTAFTDVIRVLVLVAKLKHKDALDKAQRIEDNGKDVITQGSLQFCEEIAEALSKIKVKSEIQKVNP